jgi:hypothetical protein
MCSTSLAAFEQMVMTGVNLVKYGRTRDTSGRAMQMLVPGASIQYRLGRQAKPLFIGGSLALASLDLTRRNILPTLSATLTTIALDDSSASTQGARQRSNFPHVFSRAPTSFLFARARG